MCFLTAALPPPYPKFVQIWPSTSCLKIWMKMGSVSSHEHQRRRPARPNECCLSLTGSKKPLRCDLLDHWALFYLKMSGYKKWVRTQSSLWWKTSKYIQVLYFVLVPLKWYFCIRQTRKYIIKVGWLMHHHWCKLPYCISLSAAPPPGSQQWVSRRRPRGQHHYNMSAVIRRPTQPSVELK